MMIILYHSICEIDTSLLTENREWLLPLTNRGKKKKVTPTNILAFNSTGCIFSFNIDLYRNISHGFYIWNPGNSQEIETGEYDKIHKIMNNEDFHDFMKYYMSTCPPDYFEKIDRLRNSERKTVRYQVGDIFRVEIDRFSYGYGIITGKVNDMKKWGEIPEKHSLKSTMQVPIMIRFYDYVTTEAKESIDEIINYKLGRVRICADDDILRAKHKIIGRKKLSEEDVELNLVCTKHIRKDEHKTVFTDDMLIDTNVCQYPQEYNLYIEWGTVSVMLPYDKVSDKLRELLKDYKSPHGGVELGITYCPSEDDNDSFYSKNNLLNDCNKEIRSEIFSCLGLDKDTSFDDFARQYGGLMKRKIISKFYCN